MSRRVELKRPALRSTSFGKNTNEVEIFNDLPDDLAVSDAELAALELLVGWDWLDLMLPTCGGSEADV